MKIKHLTAVFVCVFLQGAAFVPAFAQDASKINKWFDDINKKYPNLQKKQNVGDLQKPGKLQTPGQIMNANAPQGVKAIKVTSAQCSQRFLVGADTLFEFDKATLTPRAEETLTVLGPMIENVGPHPVTIEGHTDSVGTDDYNQELSERRAERVRNWLLEHRVVEKRAVSTVGFGEKKPVAPNTKPDGKDNPPGRALNRRVEIVVDTCHGLDQPAVTTAPSPANSATPQAAAPAAAPAAAQATDIPSKEATGQSQAESGAGNSSAASTQQEVPPAEKPTVPADAPESK